MYIVGHKNRDCLCATCEKNGRGGYAPDLPDDDQLTDSGSDSDDSDEDKDKDRAPLNVNERRTRRGVYHIAQDTSDDSDSEEEIEAKNDEGKEKVAKVEEKDVSSELSSPPLSRSTDTSREVGLMTPDTDTGVPSPVVFPSTPNADGSTRNSSQPTPYKSIISTRRQKAAAAQESVSATPPTVTVTKNQLVTPPPSVETASLPDEPPAPVIEKRVTRSKSSAMLALDKTSGSRGKAVAQN